MSDAVIITGAVLSFLSTTISAYLAYRIQVMGRRVEEVQRATNGMKEELVEATRSAAHAAGRRDQRDDDLKGAGS